MVLRLPHPRGVQRNAGAAGRPQGHHLPPERGGTAVPADAQGQPRPAPQRRQGADERVLRHGHGLDQQGARRAGVEERGAEGGVFRGDDREDRLTSRPPPPIQGATRATQSSRVRRRRDGSDRADAQARAEDVSRRLWEGGGPGRGALLRLPGPRHSDRVAAELAYVRGPPLASARREGDLPETRFRLHRRCPGAERAIRQVAGVPGPEALRESHQLPSPPRSLRPPPGLRRLHPVQHDDLPREDLSVPLRCHAREGAATLVHAGSERHVPPRAHRGAHVPLRDPRVLLGPGHREEGATERGHAHHRP
mmetsp:Transcript_9065/g.20076  ORF Transcript_9065/g.20076 Transcript_9065/m.20076 type:complete len:308 (+) Transcript_9065:620-1543(+)